LITLRELRHPSWCGLPRDCSVVKYLPPRIPAMEYLVADANSPALVKFMPRTHLIAYFHASQCKNRNDRSLRPISLDPQMPWT
jgi:hypothetical protein